MSEPTDEELMRMVREQKERRAREQETLSPSPEEEDSRYLASMRVSLRNYPGTEAQVRRMAERIRESENFHEPISYTHFEGKNSPFSLEFPCSFSYKDSPFFSAEHAIHYEKALHFVDRTTAAGILQADDIASVRELSKNIQNFYSPALDHIWTGLLYQVCCAKFQENNELKTALRKTSGTWLRQLDAVDHFARPTKVDEYEPDDPAFYDFVTGHNALGTVLTRIRIEFDGQY